MNNRPMHSHRLTVADIVMCLLLTAMLALLWAGGSFVATLACFGPAEKVPFAISGLVVILVMAAGYVTGVILDTINPRPE